MTQKDLKLTQIWHENGPKWPTDETQMAQKSPTDDPQVIDKWPSDPQMTHEWPTNDPQVIPQVIHQLG